MALDNLAVLREFNSLSPDLKAQVFDFIAFLKNRQMKEKPLKQRQFGYGKGQVSLSDDFDDPLEDFKDYM